MEPDQRDSGDARFRGLEDWADVVLKRAPDRRAPATLAPRVLSAIEQRRLPLHRRPFALWPIALRVAFFPFAAAVVMAITLIFRSMWAPAAGWIVEFSAFFDPASNIPGASALGRVLGAVFEAMGLHAGMVVAVALAAAATVTAAAGIFVRWALPDSINRVP